MKKLFLILILLALTGCVQKVNYQVDGQPILNNVVTSNILSNNMKVKYALINNYSITEDDESYSTQEALGLSPLKFNKINSTNSLDLRIYVFNPDKLPYRIKTHIQKEGGPDLILNEKLYDENLLYNGNLSRNEYLIKLPVNVKSQVCFYFDILNEKNDLMFKSFKVRYKIAY